ncbi:hypothetical protein LIER_20132 [Lithospermum erythrorhizon]|uniref:Uncharacterized protein n=1 Tax=Lithospermum erythrorhizon TaxID=34254 RepID=A0AAV3QMP4_LITER
MQIVKNTLMENPNNYIIGFKDNSSAIKEFMVKQLTPLQPGLTCSLDVVTRDLDILFTSETHNFPYAVEHYPNRRSNLSHNNGDAEMAQKRTLLFVLVSNWEKKTPLLAFMIRVLVETPMLY